MRELTLPAPLMLLPGLGADGDLFAPQREAFGSAVSTPEWIAPKADNEDFGRYAQRWAESINALVAAYPKDQPWFLGGVSMGGMLALEMVPHLDRLPAAVLLMASARSKPDYPGILKLGAAMANKASAKHVAAGIKLLAIPYGFREGLDDSGYRRLVKMAKASDPERLKWAIGAATEWTYAGPPETLPNGEPFPPIFQIHGRHDWLIPLEEDQCDAVIDHGRHLINLTHATTVNRWLFDRITAQCGVDESQEPRVENPRITASRRPELAARY